MFVYLRKILTCSACLALILGLTGCGGVEGDSSGGSITLSWSAPNTNADGTTLSDLSGYKVYYGLESRNYSDNVDVGGNNNVSIGGLSEGDWYFSVVACDTSGNESTFSNEVSIAIVN